VAAPNREAEMQQLIVGLLVGLLLGYLWHRFSGK
jgi:F0F1-type ATP synthase assembly protein I